MRSLLALLLSLGFLSLLCVGGCAAATSTATTSPAKSPAATPTEAVLMSMDAMAAGDQAAYRRVVRFDPPGGYADINTRATFAAARLHRAVAEHGVTGKRIRSAGFDRNEKLLVNPPPTTQSLSHARELMSKAEWRIDGDVAKPVDETIFGGPGSRTRAERVGRGWVLVRADELDAEPEHIDIFAQSAAVAADAADAATAAVKAGKLRTIREVNDFIKAHRDAVFQRELAKIMAGPPTGPIVIVTDVETGKPVAGATVEARCVIPPGRIKHLETTTDADGRAQLQMEPESIHYIYVRAEGYARRNADLDLVQAQGERPKEVHLKIGRPIVIEVMLVLPDDRHAALSVYEGQASEPAKPGVRDTIEPKRIKVPVEWADAPPKLPKHDPMLRLHLPSASPHKAVEGVVHRVTQAQLADGRDVPVFRDAPAADPQTFGLYLLGTNGFADSVFVIGTLADARAAADGVEMLRDRNTRVVGPAKTRATRPTTR